MDKLYNSTAEEICKITTHQYSTSFTLGIKAFDKTIRGPIYSIYAFARYADEIVDTFLSIPKSERSYLLAKYKGETYEAIEMKLSSNPILHSFQNIVNQYNIDLQLIEDFFISMEMDLSEKEYDHDQYQQYIYGSAEVIGLMCLKVFVDGDQNQYNSLRNSARRLGAAFQKVNFLRDMKSDFDERGRIYFPDANWQAFDWVTKKEIEENIKEDFLIALEGIKKLPKKVKKGVYLAYKYYWALFNKLRKAAPSKIQNERIRISNPIKAYILVKGLIRNYLGII